MYKATWIGNTVAEVKEMIILNLRELRQSRNMTLKDVAEGLGYSTANGYWKIEKGITELKVNQLFKLAKIFSINLSDFEMDSEI